MEISGDFISVLGRPGNQFLDDLSMIRLDIRQCFPGIRRVVERGSREALERFVEPFRIRGRVGAVYHALNQLQDVRKHC